MCTRNSYYKINPELRRHQHRLSVTHMDLTALQQLLLPAAASTTFVVLSCVYGMLDVNKVRYNKETGAGAKFEHPYKPWLDDHNDKEGRHYRGYKACQNTLEWAIYTIPMIWCWAIYNPSIPVVGKHMGWFLVTKSAGYAYFNFQYVKGYQESSKGRMRPFRARTVLFRVIAFGAMAGIGWSALTTFFPGRLKNFMPAK
jgi:hypothetical protein